MQRSGFYAKVTTGETELGNGCWTADIQLQAKFEAATRASKRIAELRTQATDAFKTIQDFKSQNNLIVNSDGKLATELELEEMADSLAKARAETALAQSRIVQYEAEKPFIDNGCSAQCLRHFGRSEHRSIGVIEAYPKLGHQM